MKKKFLTIVLFLISGYTLLACDICGCGVGSYYIGILPEFSKKIIGVRYRYNSLHTHLGAGGVTTYLTTRENYQTAELWGGWTVGKRFRIMAYIPVNFNKKINQGVTHSKTGMGDAGVQGFYQVFNSGKTIGNKMLVQSLWAGIGVKIPTGKYDAAEKSITEETANTFQLGTGSVDFTFNAMYDIRLQDAGINTSVSYKVNTENKEKYRYGNKLSANAQAYYKFRVKQILTLAPNAGVLYEKANLDSDHGYEVDISGGNILMGTIGLEAIFKRMAIGANFQTPLSQNLAGGFVKANDRAMVHLSFMF